MPNRGLIEEVKRLNLKTVDECTSETRDGNVLHNEMLPLVFLLQGYNSASENTNLDAIILRSIEAGYDINARHPQTGMTVTMMAIQCRRSDEIIVKLINAGTDLNSVCNNNKTALIYALENYYSERVILELLNNGADVNIPFEEYPPLFYAVSIGIKPDIIEMLLNAGSRIDGSDANPTLLLALCCQEGCKKDEICRYRRVIGILIEKGIDLEVTDSDGNTIIHLASCSYAIHMALKNGVPIEKKNDSQITPLLKSLLDYNKDKFVELLLIGADPNCVDKNESTPLHYYDVVRNERFTNLLLFHGADLLATNSHGHTPIDLICRRSPVYDDITDELGMKSLMKHYLLYVDENGMYESLRNITDDRRKEYFSLFTGLFRIEVWEMRNTFLKKDLSIYDFCHSKKFYRSKFIRIEIDEYKCDHENISEDFPIFKDIILMRLRDNSRKKFKSDLIKNLNKLSIRVSINSDNDSWKELLYDCWSVIGQYLNFRQLYALFLASLDRS